MKELLKVDCDGCDFHSKLLKSFIQPLAKDRGMRAALKRKEFNKHGTSNQSFLGAGIALKLERRMINVIRIMQALFNRTAYCGCTAHRNIIDINVCFKVNIGIVHLPKMNVVNVLHAWNSLDCPLYLVDVDIRRGGHHNNVDRFFHNLIRLFENPKRNHDRERRVNPGDVEHHDEHGADDDRKA